MIATADLFDFAHSLAGEWLRQFAQPWEALQGIKAEILALGAQLDPAEYEEVSPRVWVHRSAVVAPTAFLGEVCIIGPETEVRHGAFVRGSALVGAGCVVGNSVELKNVILFDKVQVPHYNYVGDSILGYRSHVPTGMKKFGAMLGDFVEVGCNSVLNPGTVIGRESRVYPLSCVRGVIPARHIWKTGGAVVMQRQP